MASSKTRVGKVQDLDDSHLFCRDLRHSWDESTMRGQAVTHRVEGQRSQRCVERTVECRRCGTKRVERISLSTFLVVARHYEYPDYYLMDKTGVPFADIRKESFARFAGNAPRKTRKQARG